MPTGWVETEQGRSRESNKKKALERLKKRLIEQSNQQSSQAENNHRQTLIGTGARSDKIVTIRFQENTVYHHITDKTMPLKLFMKGYWDELLC